MAMWPFPHLQTAPGRANAGLDPRVLFTAVAKERPCRGLAIEGESGVLGGPGKSLRRDGARRSPGPGPCSERIQHCQCRTRSLWPRQASSYEPPWTASMATTSTMKNSNP